MIAPSLIVIVIIITILLSYRRPEFRAVSRYVVVDNTYARGHVCSDLLRPVTKLPDIRPHTPCTRRPADTPRHGSYARRPLRQTAGKPPPPQPSRMYHAVVSVDPRGTGRLQGCGCVVGEWVVGSRRRRSGRVGAGAGGTRNASLRTARVDIYTRGRTEPVVERYTSYIMLQRSSTRHVFICDPRSRFKYRNIIFYFSIQL